MLLLFKYQGSTEIFAPRQACFTNYILSQGEMQFNPYIYIYFNFSGLGQRKCNLKQMFLHSAAVPQGFGPIGSLNPIWAKGLLG